MARKVLAIATIILGASISVLYLYYTPSHLAVAIADPPPIRYSGSITGIYVNISEIDIHAAGADNNSGWHTIATSISLNLMSVISTSRLLGTASLPAGKYSELRFITSEAIITINGANSTYTIPSGGQSGFKVTIPNGGFHIYGGQTLTVQLDLSFNNNEILNNPTKTLAPVATATVMQKENSTLAIQRRADHLGSFSSLPEPRLILSQRLVSVLPSLVLGHVIYAEGLVAVLAFLVARQLPAALGAFDHSCRLSKERSPCEGFKPVPRTFAGVRCCPIRVSAVAESWLDDSRD